MVNQNFLTEKLKQAGNNRIEDNGEIMINLGDRLLLIHQIDVPVAVVRHVFKCWLDLQKVLC